MEILQIQSLAERIRNAKNERLNEANTKSSLIMPFLQAMGYDVFNHNEVAQEYTSEFGTKKGEKVDIAILRDGSPVILMECKALGDSLDTGRCSQLFRYFSTQPARIGILTDGQRYLFFTDLEKQNIMDAKPFMEIDLLNFDERSLPELQKLTKETWDLDSVLSSAETLKFVRAIKMYIAEDVTSPSDAIVRFYASCCYDGKLTSKIVEIFRPIVKRAFAEHISDQISKRLNSLRVAEEEVISTPMAQDINNEAVQEDCDGIITYNTEEWGYITVRTLLSKYVESSRIYMRDQKTYCSILLDNNNRKPICRFYNFKHWEEGMENIGENAYILILTQSNDKGERFDLQFVDDIIPLEEKLHDAVKRHDHSIV